MAQKTMLFGYVFSLSIVSAIVNLVYSLKLAEIQDLLWSIPVPLILIIVFLILRKKSRVRLWFSRFIEEMTTRVLAHQPEREVLVIDSYGHSVIAQVHLPELPEFLRNKTLRECGLRDVGINLLFIKRKGEEAIPADGDTLLREGDILVAFGKSEDIEHGFGLIIGHVQSQL